MKETEVVDIIRRTCSLEPPSPEEIACINLGNYEDVCKELIVIANKSKNKRAVDNALKATRKKRKDFDGLLSQHFDQPNEPKTRIEIIRNEVEIPSLEYSILDQQLANGACPWLENYTAFSLKWSPRSPRPLHVGCGLWVLSTIAGRRVAAVDGGLQFTPLSIQLVAPSTVWGKTTTAKNATDILGKVGLDWRLNADMFSPERLLSSMSGRTVPTNYEDMSSEVKELIRLQLAHSGQRGWYASEFGQIIREIANEKGRNAAFKPILLRMDDCERSFVYETNTRGIEKIEAPYLAVLGTMTPECLKPYSDINSSSWMDGFYPRQAFYCVPLDKKKSRADLEREQLPSEAKHIPSDLVTALYQWDSRLGKRSCSITPKENEKTGKIESYIIERGEMPLKTLNLTYEAKKALDDYGNALALRAQDDELRQFQGYYGRLRDKTLRQATLFASLQNSSEIEIKHIALAQINSEYMRESVHLLDAHLRQDNKALERERTEKAILDHISEQETYVSVRMLVRTQFWKHNAEDVSRIVDSLVNEGELVKHPPMRGGGKYYTVPGKEQRNLPTQGGK